MRKALYILGKLHDQDIDGLAAMGEVRTVTSGQALIREREPVEDVFVLLAGQLVVEAAGRELARLGAGEIVGELSFLDARPPSATVRVAESGRVLAIPRAHLAGQLASDEGFAARFYRALGVFLAVRLRSTISELGPQSGEERAEALEYADEIEEGLLDELSLAGARFDALLRRLGEG